MKHTHSHIKNSRSKLFQAISFSLLAAALPIAAVAQAPQTGLALEGSQCAVGSDAERQDCRNQLLSQKLAALQSVSLSSSSAATSNTATTAYSETAVLGDADSWKTDEFMQDWGLEAMNAHHAYARGLTGSGIRIGLFDSGVGLEHTEFAGKDHQGLKIGNLLEDGTRCGADQAIGGETACFGTDGGRAQIEATYWDPSLEPYLREQYKYLAGKLVLSYGSHGTHVAGTMAANRDGNGMHGVAFGANFSSARLFADEFTHLNLFCAFFGICNRLATYADETAFEDMYQQMNAAGVRAINHSWGFGSEPEDAEEQEFYFNHEQLTKRWQVIRDGSLANGMIQVWAAGNSGTNPSPEESPIAGMHATLPRFMPELEKYWLSVVNVRQTDDADNPYVLSNRSMKCGFSMEWCIAAPGTLINSSVMGGESLDGDIEEDENGNFRLLGIDKLREATTFDYDDYSGTSMATPHITGALALLFERYPYLTNAQVRDVLLTTATDMGEAGVDEVYGWGMVNLKKAIEGYGMFRVDTDVSMVAKAGGTHWWNDARVWDVWTNDITDYKNNATFTFSSPYSDAWLRMSGNNSFYGLTVNGGILELTGHNTLGSDVNANGGVLLVNGRLDNNIQVGSDGGLGGTGTINGNVSVAGAIVPGNSVGTLTINGDYVQQAGSRFVLEMTPPDQVDKLNISGTATLNGGTVVAVRLPGAYALGQSYNFLTAAGGITGTFAGVDNSYLTPFLNTSLRYTTTDVFADIIRGASLASVAGTYNQRVTATALDSLADSNDLLQRLVLLPTAEAANAAADLLSGEANASVRSLFADDSRHVRNAALSRARTGQDAFTGQMEGGGFSAWADVMTRGGHLQGDASTAYTRYSGHQYLVGADYQFESGFRIGGFGGAGRLDANIGKRNSQ
ncbi:autotransporter outer membrane beta-barrel domain-containing protein, partial [Lysobacteraceae bacterium NML08-0793]